VQLLVKGILTLSKCTVQQ